MACGGFAYMDILCNEGELLQFKRLHGNIQSFRTICITRQLHALHNKHEVYGASKIVIKQSAWG